MEFGSRAAPTLVRIDLQVPRAGRWWLVSELRTPKRFEIRLGDRTIGTFGDEMPFRCRPVRTTDLSIPLDLAEPGETLFALVSEPHGPCNVRLRLVPDAIFPTEVARKSTTDAFVVGYMAAILLVAACLWLAVRERSFAWYVLYYAAALGWLCAKRGTGFHYLWPDLPALNPGISLCLAHFCVGAFTQFLRHLLELRRHHPKLDGLLLSGVGIQFVVAPFLLANVVHGPALLLVESLQILMPLGLLSILALRAWKGHRLSRLLLLAFVPLGLAMIYGTLVEFGLTAGGPAIKATVLTIAAVIENTLATLILLAEVRSREKARTSLEREFHTRLVESSDQLSRELSRDIHDGIGQQIYALRLHLFTGNESMPVELAQSLDQRMGTLHQDLRDVARRLHPPLLREGGLEQALASLCADLSGATDVEIAFESRLGRFDFPESLATNLYRVTQESLANALRHAKARSISVRLERRAGGIRMEIVDDGVGLPDTASAGGGMGLNGIRSRIQAMGGVVEIGPGDGKGTAVVVEVPIPRRSTSGPPQG